MRVEKQKFQPRCRQCIRTITIISPLLSINWWFYNNVKYDGKIKEREEKRHDAKELDGIKKKCEF